MFFGNQKQTEWAWQANTHFTSSFLSQSQYLFRREFFLWVINFFLLFIARWMDVLECAGKGGKPGSVPCSYSIAAEAFQQKSQHRAHIPFVSKMDHQAMEWLQRNACIMLLTFCYSQNRRGGEKKELWMSTFLRLQIFSCLSAAKEDFQLAPGRLELFLFQATRSRKAREFTLERSRR